MVIPFVCKYEQPIALAVVVRGELELIARRRNRRKEMPKKRKRRYSPSAGSDVESEMRRYKRGTAKSGKEGKVKSRKQAIAIGLSKARKEGKKVPRKAS
jgi:hypothetical protein